MTAVARVLAKAWIGSLAVAVAATGAMPPADPAETTQALAIVQECLAHCPDPWPQQWQRQYLDTVDRALRGDCNRPDYAAKIDVFQRGFTRYWGQSRFSGLSQAEFDLRKAEIRWYCQTLIAGKLAPPGETAVLRAQYHDVCDYATAYLRARFPFLKSKCVEAGKSSALHEIDNDLETPLIPIFRRTFSDDQLRTIKANWARLYMRWFFNWRRVRYAEDGPVGPPDPTNLADHPHTVFVKRCLSYLPRTIWPTMDKPPAYVLDAARKLNREKDERLRVNRETAATERNLAMRFRNQIEQVEQWSFILTALLETATPGEGVSPSSGAERK